MDRQQGRKAVAWVLLSVIVSMLLLSGLHRHEVVASAATDCVECAHHIHHSGHLSIGFDHVDDCLLCQFLQFVYTAGATAVLTVVVVLLAAVRFWLAVRTTVGAGAVCTTRGPPCCLTI